MISSSLKRLGPFFKNIHGVKGKYHIFNPITLGASMRHTMICNKLNEILDNLGNNIASRLDEGAQTLMSSVEHFLPAFLRNSAIKNTVIYRKGDLILEEPSARDITMHSLNRINNH